MKWQSSQADVAGLQNSRDFEWTEFKLLRFNCISIACSCFQDESGAQITIGKPEPKNPGDRVITIKVLTAHGQGVELHLFRLSNSLSTSPPWKFNCFHFFPSLSPICFCCWLFLNWLFNFQLFILSCTELKRCILSCLQGSNKSVQRAKFLVTQALNTPSTMAQPTPTTSTATSVNAAPTDGAETTLSSGSPIRGNYAAIPSSSSSSEWPTITQANNMSQQSQATKSTTKGSRPAEDTLSDPSPVMDDVFEESAPALPEEGCVDEAEEPKQSERFHTMSTPWSANSAWKQSSSGPQTVAVCTSAEMTSTSSIVLPSGGGPTNNGVMSNYPSASHGQGYNLQTATTTGARMPNTFQVSVADDNDSWMQYLRNI